MHWGRVGKKEKRHQAECLLNSFDFFIKLLSTSIIWLAAFRVRYNFSFFFSFLKREKTLLILMLWDELALWPGANLLTLVCYFLCSAWGLSVEGCSVMHLVKDSAEIQWLGWLPGPWSAASQSSYSHPVCPVGAECSMNILQRQLVELICLPLIVHLQCLFLKACGSGEQLHDSGVAGVVRVAIEAVMLRFSYRCTDGSHHLIELCIGLEGFFFFC